MDAKRPVLCSNAKRGNEKGLSGAFFAADEDDFAGADDFEDAVVFEESRERGEFFLLAGDFEDEAFFADVNDLRAEYVRYRKYFLSLFGLGADLDHYQFAVNCFHVCDVADLDDFDEFVELFGDLFEDAVVALDDDCDAGEGGVLRGADGEAVNVVPAAAEEARHAGEHARPVLDQRGERVFVRGRRHHFASYQAVEKHPIIPGGAHKLVCG